MSRFHSDCHDNRSKQPTYKMKFLVVLSLAVACASAADSGLEAAAQVVRSTFDSSPEGSFNYGYETENRIAAQAEGVVKNLNSNEPTLEVKGSFSYVSPDGTPVDTTYIANEQGYQAQGSHIPVAPPVPEAIARALAYIAAHPPPPSSVPSKGIPGAYATLVG